jgi:O-antigen ligase
VKDAGDGMESLNRDFERMLRQSSFISLAAALFALLLEKDGRWALGILAGSLASNINFYLLYRSIVKSLKKKRHCAFIFMYGMYLVRIGAIMGMLIICLKAGFDVFISSVLGLMVIKLVMFSNTILGRWKRWNSSQG